MGGHKNKVYDIAKASRATDEWCENDENSRGQEYVYVNLNENKESYTAYNGSKIWQAIYEENCMLDKIRVNPGEHCSEETLLY